MFRDLNLKNQGYLLLSIALTMIAVPYSVSNSLLLFLVLSCIGLCLIWMRFNDKPGAGIILISLSLCIPSFSQENYVDQVFGGVRWINYALELYVILVWLVKYRLDRCRAPFPRVAVIILLFSILYIIYPTSSPLTSMRRLVDSILFIHIIYYICSNDKLQFSDLYVSLSFIFLITGVYTILDYFGHRGPYATMFLDMNMLNLQGYDLIIRAKGLLGNSLVLTGACMAYNSMILIRYYITNRFDIVMAVFCLSISALTISRTVFVILALQYLFVFMLSEHSNKFKTIFSVSIILFVFLFLINTSDGSGVYSSILMRFGERGFSDEHRASAFTLTNYLFLNHPLGIGIDNISTYIHQTAIGGINKESLTLDNTLLTLICAFGVFSPIAIYYYFYYFFHIKAFSINKKNRMCIILICLTWLALSFSFRVEHYNTLDVLFFGLTGYQYMLANQE